MDKVLIAIDAGFEESKHPRAANGEFGSGGGASEPVSVSQKEPPPFVHAFTREHTDIPSQKAYLKKLPIEKLHKALEISKGHIDVSTSHVRGLIEAELKERITAGDKAAFDFTARTYDNVGRLHINRSHISKACVNPYYGREIPGWEALGLDPDKIYYLLRDPEELKKGASTFERIPILSKHVPVSAEDLPTELIVGSVGSDVEFLYPYLDADTSYWDATAIAGIETDQVREHSCAYHYTPVMSPGIFEGVHYDGVMTEIKGNHLALVEAGRAGSEVLAADSKLGELPMKQTKLGKALTVALTTAFPKLGAKLAQDSALGKLIGEARHTTFDKAEATKQILALDAEAPKEQVKAVMDALVDVDDPEPTKKQDEEGESAKDCKECGGKDSKHAKDCKMGKDKAAKDAEEDDEEDDDKEEKKAAKDKKGAKDNAAKDAEEEEKDKEKKDKAAMDAAIDSKVDAFKVQLREADEARREVRPVVGEVIAQDSAEQIYGFALDHMKVERKGVTGVPALKALFTLAKSHQATPAPVIAADAATLTQRFPGFNRVRVM